MVIRIPDSMFAQSTGAATAPGELDHETRSALAAARSAEQEISSLTRGLTLAGEAMKGGEKARQKLAAARDALGRRGDSGALRWLLDHAAAEQARQEMAASHRAGMRTLIGTIKGVGSLPIPFARKAELGRTLLQQGIEHGLVAPELHKLFEDAALSQFGLLEAQTALAKATEPGEALSIVAAAKAEGTLQPMDSGLLDRQAQERDAVATARHRARLAWKEQDDLAAFARGELPEPLSEESFRLVHGAKDAPGAHARYQAARKEGEAIAQIRGKDPEAIEAAQAEWKDDPAVFAAAVEKDAAERRRDPVAYAIATQPGLAQALKEAPPSETAWLLWQAQAAAGIPEADRSPWNLADEEVMANEWDALPAGASGRYEKLAFFRKHVLGLPEGQRFAAIRRLVRQGITDGTAGELTQLVDQLEAGRFNPARSFIEHLTPSGEQKADSGQLDSDAGMTGRGPVEDPVVKDNRTDQAHSPRLSPHGDVLQEGGEETQTPFPNEETDRVAAARDRIATIDAVARIDDPDDLATVLPRIGKDFADDPQAAAKLEAKARELAANPPLPASRDTEGRVRNFNEWAGDLGYYRDRHLIVAADAVQGAGYEIQIEEDGSIGVIAPDEEDIFTVLSAEEIANLNLSRPEDLARFKLLLDAVSGAAPLDELLARAEELDPTTSTTGFNPRRGPYESVHASETVELLRLASEALANGADPAAVTAALKAGLFPTSDWLVLGELLFSLTPFGLALDAVDAARAIRTLRESDDEAERERAWGDLVIAMVGVAPVGDALKLGARNIGTAKTWLRRLADQENLTTEQLIARGEHFAEIGLRKKRVSFQIERLVGKAWTDLDKSARDTVKGRAAWLYGGLAEKLVRPAAQARLKRDGYRVFDGETKLNYQGVSFNIDVVGLREGAEPVAHGGKDTIEVAGFRYLLKDVRLIDAKFASAGFTKAQRAALKKLGRRGAVQRYVPLLEDMPVEDLVEILNQIEEFNTAGITITVDMIARHAESFEKGTTLAEFVSPVIAAGLVAAMAAHKGELGPQVEAEPTGESN